MREYKPDNKNIRVLVTGATGFIGRHLIPKLTSKGYQVFALERYVTGRYILGQSRDVITVFGDLRNYFTINQIISGVQPHVVIHLAAISPVSYSYNHPNEVMAVNLTGTISLAEACLREVPHFKHFIFASTSETYGNGPTPKTEDTPQNPNSPYAISKLAGEKYLRYMFDAYKFPITILRNFNTYGRKMNSHFVIERIIVQMMQQKTVRLGDPDPIRDFMYVDDHVSSYLTCLENENAIGNVFNFCTGQGISISQLVENIKETCDFKGKIIWHTIPKRPLDISVLVGDPSKALKVLNWEPKISLKEGLRFSLDHWKKKLK